MEHPIPPTSSVAPPELRRPRRKAYQRFEVRFLLFTGAIVLGVVAGFTIRAIWNI